MILLVRLLPFSFFSFDLGFSILGVSVSILIGFSFELGTLVLFGVLVLVSHGRSTPATLGTLLSSVCNR